MSKIPYYSKIFFKSAVQYISSVHTVNWKIGKKISSFPRLSLVSKYVSVMWPISGDGAGPSVTRLRQSQAVRASQPQAPGREAAPEPEPVTSCHHQVI